MGMDVMLCHQQIRRYRVDAFGFVGGLVENGRLLHKLCYTPAFGIMSYKIIGTKLGRLRS